MRIGRVLAVVALTTMVFTACGDDDDPAVGSQQGSTSTAVLTASTTTVAPVKPIIVKDFSFAGLEVKAGSRVLVQNEGPSTHTLTAEDNRFDTGPIAAGSNASLTVPNTPGTYKIRCNIHPTRMTGELKVT